MINQFNKAQITQSFNRAANTYNQVNFLQQEAGEELFCWLDTTIKPFTIVDLGCGTGILAAKLARTFPHTQVLGIDIANNMIQSARQYFNREKNLNFLCSDADHLPMVNESVDLIFSNLMLQWSPNIGVTLTEWMRVLKPCGHLLLSTFGLGSLKELRNVWSKVDNYKHVSNFVSKEQLLFAMTAAGFKNPRFENRSFCRTFNSIYDLMLELKMLGAHNMNKDRHQGLLGKNRFKQLQIFYDAYRDHNNKLPASFEIYYVSANK